MLPKNSAMYLETINSPTKIIDEPENDPEGRGGEKR